MLEATYFPILQSKLGEIEALGHCRLPHGCEHGPRWISRFQRTESFLSGSCAALSKI